MTLTRVPVLWSRHMPLLYDSSAWRTKISLVWLALCKRLNAHVPTAEDLTISFWNSDFHCHILIQHAKCIQLSRWPNGLGICLARRRSWVWFLCRHIPYFFFLWGYLLCGSQFMLSKLNCNTLCWETVPFILIQLSTNKPTIGPVVL